MHTMAQRSDERQRRPQRAATAPLTSGNLASFNERGQQHQQQQRSSTAAASAAAGQGMHFKHRISHVSEYPAQLLDASVSASAASSDIGADDFPQTPGHHPSPPSQQQQPSSPQRRRSSTRRRAVSVASSNSTAAACMAVGQLPGSEPFELAPPSRDVLRRHSGVAAQPSHAHPLPRSSTSWLDDARGRETVYETAQYETAQAVSVRPVVSRAGGGSRNASSTSVNRVSVVSAAPSLQELVSVHSARDGSSGSSSSNGNGKRPAGGFPQRLSSLHAHPVLKSSFTWPIAQQVQRPERRESLQAPAAAVEPHPGHRVDIDADNDRPPPPPPKDPGYVSRPPGQPRQKQPRQSSQAHQQQQKRMRRHSSTPNLSSVGLGVTGVSLYSANDGELLLPHSNSNNNNARSSKPLGRRASARNRLGNLVQGSRAPHHRRFFSLRHGGGEPLGNASFREHSDGAVHGRSPSSSANRRSQMAVACARFLGRALPKSSVLKGA
jgi:hypothetical protein